MAESQEGFLTSIDADQLRQRISELAAEAARLRARLAGAVQSGEYDKQGSGDHTVRNCPLSSQYKQVAEILDASADAIITVDMQGTIRRFNCGAETVFGHRSAEVIGRPLDILLPARFRKSHRSHMARFGQSTDSSRLMNERGEIFGLRKDGVEFPAEASTNRLRS